MFKTANRYMIRKVAEEIPLEINILLWNLIDGDNDTYFSFKENCMM